MWKKQLTKFGLVHNIFLVLAVLSIACGIYFGYKYRKEEYAKKRDFIPCIVTFGLIAMEVFKIIFGVCVNYSASSLIPFQICSLSMYFMPLLCVFKKGFIKDTLLGFNGYIVATAGIAFFINPSAMLQSNYVALSLQSGIYHVLIIGLSMFVFVSNNLLGKQGIIKFLKGFVLFIICTLIAISINFIVHQINHESTLNLFYLYPVEKETFPLIDKYVRPNVPYIIYYLTFLASYFIISFLPHIIVLIVDSLKNLIQRKCSIQS